MIIDIIASLIIIILFLLIDKKVKNLEYTIEELKIRQTEQENINHLIEHDLANLYFLDNIQHYDFLNFLHKSPQSGYTWTLEEETRLINLKYYIDKEKELRGMPVRKFKHLEF